MFIFKNSCLLGKKDLKSQIKIKATVVFIVYHLILTKAFITTFTLESTGCRLQVSKTMPSILVDKWCIDSFIYNNTSLNFRLWAK